MSREPTHRDRRVLQSLLRDVRVQAGLRQEDVARCLDLPQSAVSKYESGERRIDVVELRMICRCLGISLPAFVERLEHALSEDADAAD